MATVIPMNIDGGALGGEALLRLMTWLSPSFPVGAFTYSHGIEYAVENSLVKSGSDLGSWVETILVKGAGRVDADLFRETWDAVSAGDDDRLTGVAEWAAAMRGTAEMALESSAQGRAFRLAIEKTWPQNAMTDRYKTIEGAGLDLAYPVAVAVAAASLAVPLRPALQAFLHAMSANLISAGVRLVPLGQTDGMKALAALEPVVLTAVEAALERDLGDLGAGAPLVDWTSMQHETQYTRLFRS